MPTSNQLVRNGRNKRKTKPRGRHLKGNPQRQAIVLWAKVSKPRKPNSGHRHICRVRFVDGGEVTAFIPGEGHNVQTHSRVLVVGGRRPDLPGIKYRVVRGALDCAPVDRSTSRSRYGRKR